MTKIDVFAKQIAGISSIEKLSYWQHIPYKFRKPKLLMQILAVIDNPNVIYAIRDQLSFLQLMCVMQDCRLIKYIHHPVLAVQMIAIDQNLDNFKLIKNPDPFIALQVLRRDGMYLRHFRTQTAVEQVVAAAQNGLSIQYIEENPGIQVQIIAILNDFTAIQFIDSPIEEVQAISVALGKDTALNMIVFPTNRVRFLSFAHDKQRVSDFLISDHDILKIYDGIEYLETVENPSEYLQIIAAVLYNTQVYEYLSDMNQFIMTIALTLNTGCLRKEYIMRTGNSQSEKKLLNAYSLRIQEMRTRNIEWLKERGKLGKSFECNEVMCFLGVMQTDEPIEEFDLFPYDIQLSKIVVRPRYIRFLKDPHQEIQFMSVRLNPYTIIHIKDPILEVQLAAITVHPEIIVMMRNATVEAKIEAVDLNFFLLKHIEIRDTEARKLIDVDAIQEVFNILDYYPNYHLFRKRCMAIKE